MTDDELLDALGAEYADHQRHIAESAVPLDKQEKAPTPSPAWDALYDEAMGRGMSAEHVETEAQRRSKPKD